MQQWHYYVAIGQDGGCHCDLSQEFSMKRASLIVVLFALLLSACGGASQTAAPTAAPAATEAAPTSAPDTATAEPAADVVTLKVGAVPVPHAEILSFIQENLAAEAGLNIEIVEFSDYVQPNLALADGQIDANFFQHVPYMADFGAEHNIDMVAVAPVHIEPLGLYSSKLAELTDMPMGATIAIPNDATNAGRALQLLASENLIVLKDGVGTAATVFDIVENPLNVNIIELEAAQLPRSLEDTDASIINGNYALEAGLTPSKDALLLESGENNPYANVLTALASRASEPAIVKLGELLQSDAVQQFIAEKYQGTVIPAAGEAVAPATPAASTGEVVTLKVGAVPVPHAEILSFIQENLAAEAGLNIEIVEFADYVQPNLALADGAIDANFFQHVPYMTDFGAEHNIDMVSIAPVHIEPLGLYSSKLAELTDMPMGATIAIPNDATNAGRALQLLASENLIVLKDGVGTAATVFDIVENPLNINIVELEAAQLPRSLEDTDASIINGNYALEAGLTPSEDAILLESGENNPYANILTALADRANDPAIVKLGELLQSDAVQQFIAEKYQGTVIPAGK
jgi:D-methionine transport system substrate-binding protein